VAAGVAVDPSEALVEVTAVEKAIQGLVVGQVSHGDPQHASGSSLQEMAVPK